MVFIVKIPGRSRKTSPEEADTADETRQTGMQVEGNQEKDPPQDSTSSVPDQVIPDCSHPVRIRMPTSVSMHDSDVGSAPAPLQLTSVSETTPASRIFGQTKCSTSTQDALDALSMLSMSSPSPQPEGRTGQVSSADNVYPVLSMADAAASQSDPLPVACAASTPAAASQSDTQPITVAVPTPPMSPPLPSTFQPSIAPLLDIIVAPAVLAHRYIRGKDVSLIVERPERIRAVLLGVAALLARMAESNGCMVSTPSSARQPSTVGGDADDLAAQLQGMHVGGEQDAQSDDPIPVQVLHSTRSVSLHPPHPALAVVHAHQEDLVDSILPEYEQRRKERSYPVELAETKASQRDDKASIPFTSYSSYLSQLCSYAPHSAPVKALAPPRARDAASATTTPNNLGRTRRSTRQASPGSASTTPISSQRREGGVILSNDLASGSTAKALHENTSLGEDTKLPSLPNEKKSDGTLFCVPPTSPQIDHSGSAKEDIRSRSSSPSDEEQGDLHPSEVPAHLSQGDLYLRGSKANRIERDLAGYGSAEAIQHALAASIEAVDRVCATIMPQAGPHTPHTTAHLSGSISSLSLRPQHDANLTSSPAAALPSRRAFVLTRPPGHHCSGSAPSGFCWVNNAAVAAVHAYQAHGVDRVVIFDIDLHHGNGTQKIAWKINEETRRGDLERNARIKAAATSLGSRSGSGRGKGARKSGGTGAPTMSSDVERGIPPRGLQVFYSSLHDIESFPCEDGDADLVRDASVCLQGAHGQWTWNVHLDTYDSPTSFDNLYRTKYSQLFTQARHFLTASAAEPSKTLILISCGFDACSYELQGMQRHGKNVPPGFYEVFARDAVRLSEERAGGKVVSLLEGGYGDRALCSASIAHLKGLATPRTNSCSSGDELQGAVPQSPDESTSAALTPTPARHYSSVGSAMDPYAHQWFSLESLKALEKTMANVLRARSLARSKQGSSQNATNGFSTPTTGFSPVKRRGAGGGTQGAAPSSAASTGIGVRAQDWLALSARYFTTFEELCEPLTLTTPPASGAGRR